MAAFVQRYANEPEAVRAGQVWEESSGKPPTSAAEHARFLQGILPAYFADYWAVVALHGPTTLRTHYDPSRIRSTWDVRDRLGQIDGPTLVISGLYDFVCARRFSDEIAPASPALGQV